MKAPCRIGLGGLLLLCPAVFGQQGVRTGAAAGRMAGYVQGHYSQVGAVVVVCDGRTGIPVHRATWKPFTERMREGEGEGALDVVHTRTKAKGRFEFNNVPAGTYRLVAQSWTGEFRGVFEVNGAVIELHGVADGVTVPSPEAEKVRIAPLGDGVLQIDQSFGNSEGLLMVSRHPPLGDPVLGFVGLGDTFLANIVGANRMPYGRTTVVGLPRGRKAHVAVFMPDNMPGFASGSFEVSTGRVEKLPMVAPWSDAQHDAPPAIQRIIDAVRAAAGNGIVPRSVLHRLAGVEEERIEEMEQRTKGAHRYDRHAAYLDLLGPLERRVRIEGAGDVRVIDLLAAFRYMDLQRYLERMRRVEPTQEKP